MIPPHFYHLSKLLGDSWILLILYTIQNNPLRFNQIKEELPQVTSRTLSLKLKILVDQGILTKSCPDNNRNFCEYSLTERGAVLKPILKKIEKTTIDIYYK